MSQRRRNYNRSRYGSRRRGGLQQRGRNNIRSNQPNRGNFQRTIVDYTNDENQLTIFNELGRFSSNRTFIKMRFVDPQTTRGNTAARVTNWAYNSRILSIDGGGTMPLGFTAISNMYERFRIHSMNLKLQLTNVVITPLTVVIWPSDEVDTFTTNTMTLAQIQNAMCLPGAKTCLTGTPNANALTKCTCMASALKLIGPSYFRDDDAITNGLINPFTRIYLNVGVFNTDTANFGVLLPIVVTIDMDVECFERITSL